MPSKDTSEADVANSFAIPGLCKRFCLYPYPNSIPQVKINVSRVKDRYWSDPSKKLLLNRKERFRLVCSVTDTALQVAPLAFLLFLLVQQYTFPPDS